MKKGRMRWLLPPLLFISCFCVAYGSAQQEEALAAQILLSATSPHSHVSPGDFGSDGASEKSGSERVKEAIALLQSLPPAPNRQPRPEKQRGAIGTLTYLAKQIFSFLFLSGPGTSNPFRGLNGQPKRPIALTQAVKMLEEAAAENNPDAIYLLGQLNFYGEYSHPRNYTEAFRRYYSLASLNGNSTAQHMVGFMYATGFGGATAQDAAKALLYYTFAALGGDIKAEMSVAYMHHVGIATPKSCQQASFYYKRAAEKVIEYFRTGPPGGQRWIQHGYRLADDEGGVYGEGASVSSAGLNAYRAGVNSDRNAAQDDILEYLDLMSGKGHMKETFLLARMLYEGSRGLPQNYKKARFYFMIIIKKHWGKDGKPIAGGQNGIGKLASKAAGYLGRMALRGEGMTQNFDKAILWFRRGIENGDALSQNGLGLMYLHGHGVPKNAMRAATYFKSAADQDSATAQVNAGILFLDQGDIRTATKYFELASRHGHIEAYYFLAELSSQGYGNEPSCAFSTACYKIVAEKGEPLHTPFEAINQAYEDGDMETALVGYTMAAEQGYEIGQSNVAHILDGPQMRHALKLILPFRKAGPSILNNPKLALQYWTRSANQMNTDSLVKMGDYYLWGVGSELDNEKAAACYLAASEYQRSAQAQWNLGWMHENGIGVEQDFHLAKRYYDMALESNQEAYLPVSLSLIKLRMRSFWNTITRGQVKSIQPEPEEDNKWSFGEWIQHFIQGDGTDYYADDGDPADPSFYSSEHMHAGEDDYYDAAEDGMVESTLIVGLAAALAFLLYYRQQRQLNHRRAGEQDRENVAAAAAAGVSAPPPASTAAPASGGVDADGGGEGDAGLGAAPQEDRGLFPQPDDANYPQWLAGGVGH
ncbi:MAG: ERAD-associated protein [Trizodia sp. TS-e1964]|nr:MAG: ERAD-associated protein [Trizodia sp. TS-e1964]